MGDPFVVCPFNKSHKIMMSRLQGHLSKCMKSYSITEPVVCPFNDQHIIETSKIVEHCIICPSIKDVLMQTNTCKNNSDILDNNISSKPISDCHFPVTEAPNLKFRSSLKDENPQTSIEIPNVRKIDKSDNKNSFRDVSENNETFEKHHQTIADDTDSTNQYSCVWSEQKSSSIYNIDYGAIYHQLEELEEKEGSIAREMQFLRNKEKDIEKKKKELIKILKCVAIYMDSNNDYYSSNNNQESKITVACNDEIDSDADCSNDQYSQLISKVSSLNLEEKSSNHQNTSPSMISSTSTNKPQSRGRGIMKILNQRKSPSNKYF